MQGLRNWHHRRKASASPSAGIPSVEGCVFDTTLISKGFFVGEERVNCVALLQNGQSILYGTNNGVFFQRLCGDLTSAPIKVLDLKKVNHIGMLKEPELLVVSTSDSVFVFPCVPTEGFGAITPDKGIKVAKAVTLLKTGHHLGSEVLCLVKSQKLSSTINVLRPLDSNKESSSAERPKTQQLTFETTPKSPSLKVFKEFYVASQCYSVHFLKTKLVLACTSGFEIVDLETLDIQALLDPADVSLRFLKAHRDPRPITLYRLEANFLLCYTHCAFHVDKNGWRVEDNPIMEWNGVSNSFAFNYPYLVICLPKHIEVRDVRDGKAVQVIQGDNFRCLFENNEPSKPSLGVYPGENKPMVMVSDSQVVLLQSRSPSREAEAGAGQDAEGLHTVLGDAMTLGMLDPRVPTIALLYHPSSYAQQSMTTSQVIARHPDFSQSPQGKVINRLLIASLVVGTISFALGMVRFGTTSIFLIPSAWALMLLHHITVLCRLAKYKKRTTVPTCDTPPFLKHAFNIWTLVLSFITWLAGGITTITITASFSYYTYYSGFDVIDILAGALGIIEGGLVLTLVVFCWKALSREGYSGVGCNRAHMHVVGDAESTMSDKDSCMKHTFSDTSGAKRLPHPKDHQLHICGLNFSLPTMPGRMALIHVGSKVVHEIVTGARPNPRQDRQDRLTARRLDETKRRLNGVKRGGKGGWMGARGPKKHLKRLAAPSSWMLDKLSGTYAPRPSPGPHKLRESLPLSIFLRNRLKYALTGREVTAITAQRLIKVDGKVRTDNTYPTGFMDVVSIEKSGEHFRLLYDVKGRFVIHRITAEEATYKLLKVRKVALGARGVPYVVTHDGRTIRYPDPSIKVNDTVKFDLTTGKITDSLKFDTGNFVTITGGRNMGRAGTIVHRERHIGGFDVVHVKDVLDRTFATRISNIFVIGEGSKPWVSLPKGKGTKLTISEERDQRRRQRAAEV
ncbi:40S ribosomal protein S4 [Ceratobasidium sp. 414]|nr:40S ribosomal protein S4 [Ceratobasidium sp. 414]